VTVRRRLVLLDECLPHEFRHALPAHDVQTAAHAGVAGLSNGHLLDAIEGRFDVLVTVDGSMSHQQSIAGRPIAIAVLRSKTNRIKDLLPLAPALSSAIAVMAAGDVTYV
jgi:hypothetical protein